VRRFLIDDEAGKQTGPNDASWTGDSEKHGASSSSVVKLADDRRGAAVAWLPSESCGSRIIFEAVRDSLLDKPLNGSFNVGVAILREWMAIARKRDAYGLMHTTIGVSQLLGISLDTIVVAEDAPPHLDANGRVEMPPPIAALVQASSGYTVARTSHHGHMGFSCSPDFERDICSVSELYRAWRENKVQVCALLHEGLSRTAAATRFCAQCGGAQTLRPLLARVCALKAVPRNLREGAARHCDARPAAPALTRSPANRISISSCSQAFSIFVHERDFDAIPALVGKLWRGVSSNRVPHLEASTYTVRIRRRVAREADNHPPAQQYENVPCSLKGAIYVEGDGRKVSLALTFEPKPVVTPALAPPIPTGLPAGRFFVQTQTPPASELVLRKPEALYGVPQSALGTLPVGRMMPAAHPGASSSAHAPGVHMTAAAAFTPHLDSLREGYPSLPAAPPAPAVGRAPVAAGGSTSFAEGGSTSFAENLAWPRDDLSASCSSSFASTELGCSETAGCAHELIASMSVPSHIEMAAVTLSELGAILGLGSEDDVEDGMEDRINEILEQIASQ
jgi:hypothetical protein